MGRRMGQHRIPAPHTHSSPSHPGSSLLFFFVLYTDWGGVDKQHQTALLSMLLLSLLQPSPCSILSPKRNRNHKLVS